MRFNLTPKFILFSVLCVCLMSEEVWLKNAPASNTGRIAFTSLRDRHFEIYVMDADGGNQVRLTNNRANDTEPDWSPDGRKIAFASSRLGVRQIYVMDADGKNLIRLTEGQGHKGHPDWSPDGGKIAFSVDDWDDYIAVMDADGNNRVKLEDQAWDPSWSPDGQWIVFLSSRDGGGEIYLVGTGRPGPKRQIQRVTHDLVRKDNPSFSPDGRLIAYVAEHGRFFHIFVVGADGKNQVRLTHNEENHWGPTWTPDGQAIGYFLGDWDTHGTIHLMTADGGYIRQLSDGDNTRDFEPDISPLGLAVSPDSVTTTTWGRLKQVEPNRR